VATRRLEDFILGINGMKSEQKQIPPRRDEMDRYALMRTCFLLLSNYFGARAEDQIFRDFRFHLKKRKKKEVRN